MYSRKTFRVGLMGLIFIFFLCVMQISPAYAAGSSSTAVSSVNPKKITLNKTSVKLDVGKTVTLKATLTPSKVKNKKIIWKSSKPGVAKVTSSGKVKALSAGKARITATAANGRNASCVVTVHDPLKDQFAVYAQSGALLRVRTGAVAKMYVRYTMGQDDYLRNQGCVTTAVAFVASAFGVKHTPYEIYKAPVTAVWGEKYAIKKLGMSDSMNGRVALSLLTATQILRDNGIKTKTVYQFNTASAVKEITAHLKKGFPVIIKCHDRYVNGVSMSLSHHAMVLVGIDQKGYVLCYDPGNGLINVSHVDGRPFKLTVQQFVQWHARSSTAGYLTAYATSTGAAGGYILVG